MIRRYADSDLDAVLDVWYRASLIAHSFLPDEFFDTERRLLADEWLPQSETWVAEVGDTVVGFLSLVGPEVGGLFVDPDLQRQGVGRNLMEHARRLRSGLELGVFEENTQARAFSKKCGFIDVGRVFNADAGHVEIRMRLEG